MKLNNKFLIIVSFLLMNLTLMFVRSFTGLYIFGFRIGEFYIGFCFLVFLYILIDLVIKKSSFFMVDNKISIVLAILSFLFFISIIDLNNFIIDPYFLEQAHIYGVFLFFT